MSKIGSDVVKTKKRKKLYIPPRDYRVSAKRIEIERKGKKITLHRKEQTIHRKGHLIKDRGAIGRGPKVIPPLKGGEMSKHLLPKRLQDKPFFSCSVNARRNAIVRSVKEDGYITVKGRLFAIHQLTKRTNRTVSRKARSDFNWLVKNYGLQAGFPLGK